MLIEMLLNLLFNVFSALTSAINLPSFPTEVTNILNSFVEYVTMGIGILANYTHLPYLLTLFGIVVAVEAGILLYKFVMWVLRKIPMINIS